MRLQGFEALSLGTLQSRFRDPFLGTKHVSLAASEGDAAEEAHDDGISRLLWARLDQIINMKHELAPLAG